jgi:hypothetical protein
MLPFILPQKQVAGLQVGHQVNLGALCSVGPTPNHPELGCEKAEGTEELYGSPSGISVLVPGLNLNPAPPS